MNIYPANVSGSLDFDYHLIVYDTVPTTWEGSKNKKPCRTTGVIDHMTKFMNTNSELRASYMYYLTSVLESSHYHDGRTGGKIGHISEVGNISAIVVEKNGIIHTIAITKVVDSVAVSMDLIVSPNHGH